MKSLFTCLLFTICAHSVTLKAQSCEEFKASIARMDEIEYKIYNLLRYSMPSLMEQRRSKGSVILNPTKDSPTNILFTNPDGTTGHKYTETYIKKWEVQLSILNKLRIEYKTLAKELKKHSKKYYLTEDINSYKSKTDKEWKFKNRAGYLIRDENNRFHYEFSGYTADILSLYSSLTLQLKADNGYYGSLDNISKDFYKTSKRIQELGGVSFYKDHVICEVK